MATAASAAAHRGTHPLLAPLLNDDLVRWPPSVYKSVSLADTDAAYASIPPYARARFVIVNGTLWKAKSRCVYRRDETTAWALLQLMERYPSLPDLDVVLNCRDGPLLRRPRTHAGAPLIFSYSSTRVHSEVALPDYTLWGLPGKIKPWPQLRLDLLYRAQQPFAHRLPRLLATGVVNDYHSSLGVRARQAVQQCAAASSADTRLDVRYHRLYFERFYSTEEHCAHRYILLAPGSHAVWLDHLKQKLLCGSLVMLLEPPRGTVPPNQVQFDVLTRLLTPGVHYLSLPLPDLSPPDKRKRGSHKRFAASQQHVCNSLSRALDWAESNPVAAETIAAAGRALVRDALTMHAVYAYMEAALVHASKLLSYPPAHALSTHRVIPSPKGAWWFNASNFTRMSRDPGDFVRVLRNDSETYPITAQVATADWAAVVLHYNYSRMGHDFTRSARELQAERFQQPRLGWAQRRWHNFTASYRPEGRSKRRRVWVLIPFGFELSMLRLHIETLQDVVDGFLIVESRTDIAKGAPKPAHLSDALAAGRFPRKLASAIHLVVQDDREKPVHPGCGPWPTHYSYDFRKCLESWQRFRALELLLEIASPDDIALLSDTDEIARPEAVALLRRCHPFGRDGAEPGMVGLEARAFTYGLHCRRQLGARLNNPWNHGPHAFSVAFLGSQFPTAALASTLRGGGTLSGAERKAMQAFSETRYFYTHYSRPFIFDGGWHLSYWGTPSQLVEKFKTWGHSRTFAADTRRGFVKNGYENASLAPWRIERCAKLCLEPTVKSCQALGVPCDWKQFTMNLVPPCGNRSDGVSKPLAGHAYCPQAARDELEAGRDYPLPLASASRFADFFWYDGR